jgi:hypothetical protein
VQAQPPVQTQPPAPRPASPDTLSLPHHTTTPPHHHPPPTPAPQVNDTVMLDIESGKIKDFVKFDVGNLAMVTGGHNNGRVGTIVHKEKHKVRRAGGGWKGRRAAVWFGCAAEGRARARSGRRRSAVPGRQAGGMPPGARAARSAAAASSTPPPHHHTSHTPPLTTTQGSFDIITIEDAAGSRFATRMTNVFVIGKGQKPLISLPKGKGIRLTILQEQAKRYQA